MNLRPHFKRFGDSLFSKSGPIDFSYFCAGKELFEAINHGFMLSEEYGVDFQFNFRDIWGSLSVINLRSIDGNKVIEFKDELLGFSANNVGNTVITTAKKFFDIKSGVYNEGKSYTWPVYNTAGYKYDATTSDQSALIYEAKLGENFHSVAEAALKLSKITGKDVQFTFSGIELTVTRLMEADQVAELWQKETARKRDEYRNSPEGKKDQANQSARDEAKKG